MPHLFVVSINGADHEGDWDRLIQTLDRGEYDVLRCCPCSRSSATMVPSVCSATTFQGDIRENLTQIHARLEGISGADE